MIASREMGCKDFLRCFFGDGVVGCWVACRKADDFRSHISDFRKRQVTNGNAIKALDWTGSVGMLGASHVVRIA